MNDSKDLWELGQIKGKQDEYERIIKMFERPNAAYLVLVDVAMDAKNPDTASDILIALIKGEQK